MPPNERLIEKLKRRNTLIAEITTELDEEIDRVLAAAPDSLAAEDRKAIKDEVTAHTRLVTDALTTEELEDEGARRSFVCGATATARHLINVRMAQTSRG